MVKRTGPGDNTELKPFDILTPTPTSGEENKLNFLRQRWGLANSKKAPPFPPPPRPALSESGLPVQSKDEGGEKDEDEERSEEEGEEDSKGRSDLSRKLIPPREAQAATAPITISDYCEHHSTSL